VKVESGDLVTVDFPAVTGIKRRPAVVLSLETYQANRPDVIVGLITSQTKI
jgi:mRNA interferase MazF